MIYVVIVLTILLLSTCCACWILFKRLENVIMRHEELGEQINESLDVLDDVYRNIVRISELPVFYDDPVVHDVISNIKRAHAAVLMIANKIVTIDDDEEQEVDSQDKKDE